MIWIAVLVGGALGSAARHAVNISTARLLDDPGPYATATVNIDRKSTRLNSSH